MSPSPQSEERSNIILPKHHAPYASAGSSNDSVRLGPLSTGYQRDVLPRSAPALPPLASLTSDVEHNREQGAPGPTTSWRSLGVRNILNPAAEAQSTQARPVPPSPQTAAHPGQRSSHGMPTTSPHIRKRGEPHSPVMESQSQQGGRTGRRILTPRSPALRAASMGSHRSPSVGAGLITRVPLPAGEGRGYTAEPGEGRDAAIPPLPPLSAAARSAISNSQTRDLSSSAMQSAPVGILTQPQEKRPDPSRPPYMSGESNSSGFLQGQNQMPQPPAPTAGEGQTSYMPAAPGPVRSGLQYGQTEYQLTFETQQGPMVVPVNVDYQQASRLADEKRKRNAGASARFRARRKEKEREANATIAGLQQELQELAEEREFYLRERNFFRDMLSRSNPGPLPARPHSPQARRVPVAGSTTAETSPTLEYGRPDMEPSNSQRRRTGEYQPSITSQSPSTPYNPPFPPPGPSMTLPAPSTGNTYPDSRVGPSGPPPPSSRPPPYDPLRRNVLDRDWNMGR